jgi:hypothetical protein
MAVLRMIKPLNVPFFCEYFDIDQDGNIYSKERMVKCKSGKYRKKRSFKIKSRINWNGYIKFQLRADKKMLNIYAHRAIAETFIPKIDGKNVVNHKDGVKLNNSIHNLEWVTQSENLLHAIRIGLKKYKKGCTSKTCNL